jgi:hypothetical protein
LVYVKEAKKIGEILPGHAVFMVQQAEILPYETKTLSEEQQKDEHAYKELIHSLFNERHTFYFSHTFDLTVSLQTFYSRKLSQTPQQLDEQFMWNRYIATPFFHENLQDFVTPIIRGFVSLNQVPIDGKVVDFNVISRLSWKRVGTRYNTRGVDQQGNVANFVETEQILRCDNNVMSFLQIRGSIPLFWTQKPNLSYKPKARIHAQKNISGAGFRPHFDTICPRADREMACRRLRPKASRLPVSCSAQPSACVT